MVTGRVFISILTAILIVTVCAPMLQAQEENLNLAKNLLSEKKYDDALKCIALLIDEYPEWFWGYFLAGHAYQGKKNYTAAISYYTKAMDYSESDEETFTAKVQIARAYYEKGDYENTLRFIDSARIHRQSRYYVLASEYLRTMEGFSNFYLKRFQAAINSFKPLMDAGKSSPDMMRAVAISHMELGNNEQAIDLARQILVGDPNNLPAYTIWIQSHINLKQWNEAINVVEMAEKKFWNDVELCYLMAQALSEAGNSDAAISSLERTSFVFNIPKKVPRLLAKLYFEKGDYLRAIMQYRMARDEYQDDAAFLLEFATCSYQYVPANAEDYDGKAESELFEKVLNEAEALLNHAKDLPNADENSIDSLVDKIGEKRFRLTHGIDKINEIYVDPNTGEIKRKEYVKEKK